MTTLKELANKYSTLTDEEVTWLELLMVDVPLLADLAFGDIVLWAPTKDGNWLAVAHARASSTITLFYRDIIGDYIREDWRDVFETTLRTGEPAVSTSPAWYEENPMGLTAYAVPRLDAETGSVSEPFAVMTVHTSHAVEFSASRQILAFKECADDLCRMVLEGAFPYPEASLARRQGAPRASDGLIRVNTQGIITFASPNSQSSFSAIGFRDELEGQDFAEVLADLTRGQFDTNESIPLIGQGKVYKRSDIEVRGKTLTLRAIPVTRAGERIGGIVLTRDITAIKAQEQMLITKDATIREIHHRVKNNLQTVASLLRVQARRAESEDAKDALSQAMRRVASIAVVHDTLASGLSQDVEFDEVFDRVLSLATEVASLHGTVVHLHKDVSFGSLPSEYATPFALALTEVVTNAVEHGLRGIEGDVSVIGDRNEDRIHVQVDDNGTGLPDGKVGDGLGTQIVRTLIEGELGGSISWQNNEQGGARVIIDVPLHWIAH